METEVKKAKKKSVILRPKHQGDVKVVLAKHYLAHFDGEEINEQATAGKVQIPLRSLKRTSFELKGIVEATEINKQCHSSKRRRSVQLTATLKPTVSLAMKDLVKNKTSRHDVDKNVFWEQKTVEDIQTLHSKGKPCESAVKGSPSRTKANESSGNVSKTNQQHDRLINCVEDCNLLPDRLEEINTETLDNSLSMLKFGGHKVLQLSPNLDSPKVKNTVECKSFFETYQFNKVHKSIVDEI